MRRSCTHVENVAHEIEPVFGSTVTLTLGPALAFGSICRYPLPSLLVPQQGMLAWGQKAKVLKSGSVASEGNVSSRTHIHSLHSAG
jgi:hypothetical protein